jgi:hopanoid biosynthesis associated protein HpnK
MKAPRRFLVVTADDFGLHPAVNEAVWQATRSGILTAASLMVAAPAADEAVRLAHALPSLRVGLHLVLTEGDSLLGPRGIPELVGENGRFADRMVLDSFRYCVSARVRQQLRAEIRAQFEAFARTGLVLDHVNAHKHFHVHPGILRDILQIGRDFGIRAVRVPSEPLWFAASRPHANWLGNALLGPWMRIMRSRIRRSGCVCNDTVFGMACTGQLDEATLLSVLARLPAGLTEIYMHPACTDQPITPAMSGYRHADELAALLSPSVRQAATSCNAAMGGYDDARLWARGRARLPQPTNQ